MPAFLNTLLALAALGGAQQALVASSADECLRDLESIPGFMLANDAGGRDTWDRHGSEYFVVALNEARAQAAIVTDAGSCTAVLRTYLGKWRAEHLAVIDRRPQATVPSQPDAHPRDLKPRVQWLSKRTALLVLPSFDNAWRQPVLDLLKENHAALASHPAWIIDVRGNGGGSDIVYEEVMRWIGAASRVEVQPEYWVTEANIEATRTACALMAPGDQQCEQAMRQERERMQSAPLDSWILQQPRDAVLGVRQDGAEKMRPQKVAILVDGGCMSSCEEFLLSARQSFSVKLLGQHSGGVLDVSNLRPHVLPSQRLLFYAVTRSKRIPGMPVDGIGVMPDVYLPAEQAEAQGNRLVESTQHWLEGGELVHAGS